MFEMLKSPPGSTDLKKKCHLQLCKKRQRAANIYTAQLNDPLSDSNREINEQRFTEWKLTRPPSSVQNKTARKSSAFLPVV